MNRDERIVVVGAGLTGLRAAERLRELKFEGEVLIIGDERVPPYHRPALSKQLLMGTLQPSDLTLPAYEDVGAKWRLGTEVRQLLPRNKTLQLPGGEEIGYDGLVIATGVEARRPNDVPYHDPRVLVLRTLRDALDLERAVSSTRGPVAVVGGGFTGCEIAASLRHLGREVTLIGRSPNLLGNVLGPALGDWLTGMHRDHGVDLALGNSVKEWDPTPEGIGLKLADGSTLLASCVVVAAGTVPITSWLRGSGLPLDNGVVCEPTCHVVGAEDVVAAGDVAQWPNLRFDNVPRRVEHWLNAVEMGRAAAESLLAGRGAAEPFTPMPRFWTEQYGVRIQAAGMPKLGPDIIALGTPDEGTGTVFGYSREGRLMGVVGLDCPSSVLAWTDSVCRQNPTPRQRQPLQAGAPERPAITAGPSKKRMGRHQLPAKEKAGRRGDVLRKQDIGWVGEDIPSPAATSGPLPAVGGGRLGGPQNPVDSFSRMLPVAVRPPVDGQVVSNGTGPAGPARLGPTDSNGRMRPVVRGRQLGPATSSAPAEPSGYVPPAAANGHPVGPGPQSSSGGMAPVGHNGHPVVPGDRFEPAGANGHLVPPADRFAPAGANGHPMPSGRFDPADRFEQTGRNGFPVGDRFEPAGHNGHPVASGGGYEPAGRNGFPVDSGDRFGPPARNGHPVAPGDRFEPAGRNGHSGGAYGPGGRNGFPVDSGDRFEPAGHNGHSGGGYEPAGRNGFPVDSGGIGPRYEPAGRNGHPSFPPRQEPPGRNGHSFPMDVPARPEPTGRRDRPRRNTPALADLHDHEPSGRHSGRRAARDQPSGRHGHSGPADSGWRIEPVEPAPPSLSRLEPVKLGRAERRRRADAAPPVPPPLSGRLHPADPIVRGRPDELDVTSQLPPLDRNGYVRSVDVPAARPGPADSYGQMPPVRRAAAGSNGRRYR